MAKVVVGLSGGVDSSVAAYLLKQQGYEVVGLFMRNWHDTTGTLEGDCPWYDDQLFAELVAKRLDIPFKFVDLSEEYRKRVVDYMFSEYEQGRTPNPDVLCNREIKFDVFLKEALKLGADYVATGHYCRKAEEEIDGRKVYRLLAGADKNKDQSYFLCQLTQEQLRYAMFPIGDLQKPEVRRIAEEQKLATAKRKDSQGICFVGKVDLPVFLQQQLTAKQGNIHEILPSWRGYNKPTDGQEQKQTQEQDLEKLSAPYRYTVRDGKKIGTHNGAHFYTIGQRKGLGIGGRKEGDSHPGLYRKALRIQPSEVHWVEPLEAMREGESREYMVRIRYRQPLQRATLEMRGEGLYIVFDEPQRGIAAGQFAAWYEGEVLAGSGVIEA